MSKKLAQHGKGRQAMDGHYAKWISQTKINAIWYHVRVEYEKCNRLVDITKKQQTHRYREQTSGYQLAEGSGEGQDRDRVLRSTNY